MAVHSYMTSFKKTNQIITQGLFHFIAPKLMHYPCTVPMPTVKIYIANWYAFSKGNVPDPLTNHSSLYRGYQWKVYRPNIDLNPSETSSPIDFCGPIVDAS